MTLPQEIALASRQYEDYAADLQSRAMLQTHNQVYSMTRAVLHETRDCLSVAQAIGFCQGLPAVLRAIFVESWDVTLAPRTWSGEADFAARVVKRLSPHVIPPDTIVGDVTACIRLHSDPWAYQQGTQCLTEPLVRLWS